MLASSSPASNSHQTLAFTQASYTQLQQTGILDPEQKYELIEGVVYHLLPPGISHAYQVRELYRQLSLCYIQKAEAFIVDSQNPVNLGVMSQPQPDVFVLRGPPSKYKERLPEAEDIFLVIEVADSSLAFDQQVKLELYAKASIPHYWILNIQAQLLQCYSKVNSFKACYDSYQLLHPGSKAHTPEGDCALEWWS